MEYCYDRVVDVLIWSEVFCMKFRQPYTFNSFWINDNSIIRNKDYFIDTTGMKWTFDLLVADISYFVSSGDN